MQFSLEGAKLDHLKSATCLKPLGKDKAKQLLQNSALFATFQHNNVEIKHQNRIFFARFVMCFGDSVRNPART
jgi:hypothetical protein